MISFAKVALLCDGVRFWVGIGSDKTIEQTLMRSFKTAGGLTIGGSMDEAQAIRWCLAMATMAVYSQVIEEATELCYMTREQHIDLSEARIMRDHKDRKCSCFF